MAPKAPASAAGDDRCPSCGACKTCGHKPTFVPWLYYYTQVTSSGIPTTNQASFTSGQSWH